jgi:glycosyltransferase involved in cell wall biosynthesis
MARGLPCIATSVGGIPELLAAEDLVEPNDVDALAARMCEVLSSPERMKQMSARNLEKAGEFRAELLDQRRDEFLAELRERTQVWLSAGAR